MLLPSTGSGGSSASCATPKQASHRARRNDQHARARPVARSLWSMWLLLLVVTSSVAVSPRSGDAFEVYLGGGGAGGYRCTERSPSGTGKAAASRCFSEAVAASSSACHPSAHSSTQPRTAPPAALCHSRKGIQRESARNEVRASVAMVALAGFVAPSATSVGLPID